MTINVELLLDSVFPTGARLTTWQLTYPRFIHSELLTHRVLSKNSASSRAIPTAKLRAMVREDPAMPVWWGKAQPGMQAKEELTGEALAKAKALWIRAMNAASMYHEEVEQAGLHKQITNRIIEPWMQITIIMSTTHMDNWLMLRDHPDAQPEIHAVAERMREAFERSEKDRLYQCLKPGMWHRPFWRPEDEEELTKRTFALDGIPSGGRFGETRDALANAIAIGRMARVSYLTHEGRRDMEEDLNLFRRLITSKPAHLSPSEHVARSLSKDEWEEACNKQMRDWYEKGVHPGNFWGVAQYRKMLPDEVRACADTKWESLYHE